MLTDVQISMLMSSAAAGEVLCCGHEALWRRQTVVETQKQSLAVYEAAYDVLKCSPAAWDDELALLRFQVRLEAI